MFTDLTHNLIDAWNAVRPRLLLDSEELGRRLARRGSSQVTRPPRAWCVAVRASDRRIHAASAILDPAGAADVDARGRYVDPRPHTVTLDARLLQALGGAVDLTVWRGHSLGAAAAKLGVSPESLKHVRDNGSLKSDRIFGLGGAKVAVPRVWAEEVRDPNAANGHRPPDAIWGNAWRRLGSMVDDDFAQTLAREPCYRPGPRGEAVRGWRWVCPRCEARVRSVFLPRPVPTLPEWLGDEAVLAKISGTDALRPTDETFACTRCHRIRYFTSLTQSSWNQLVTTLSGGLLYGSEVRRPAGFQQQRRRVFSAHAAKHPRADELERLLIEGKSYAAAAETMGVKLSTVQGHVKRLYARRGVHSRKELARR